MSGHQKVIVTGHLGDDARISAPQSGGLIASFSIAVGETWKDRDGNKVEHTEWIRCKCFRGLAEVAEKYARKGRLVTVEGKLRTEKWQAQDSSDRYSTWVYVDELKLYGGRDHTSTRAEHRGRKPADEPAAGQLPTDEQFTDDDLPF